MLMGGEQVDKGCGFVTAHAAESVVRGEGTVTVPPHLSLPRSFYTPNYTPFALHPTPYTLHPTPYTLHPTPYTQTR